MNLNYEFANGWKVIKEMNNMENAFEYSKEYIDFLNKSKTERLCAREIIRQASSQGFISIEEAIKKGKIECGDNVRYNAIIQSVHRLQDIAKFIRKKDD